VVAVEKAKKLVEHDEVDVLLGCLWGASVVAVAGYVNGTDVCYAPFVQQSMQAIRNAPDNVVLPTGTLAGSTYAAGLYTYDELGYRTATTCYQDFLAGEEFIGGFETGFKDSGGNIIQRQGIAAGTIDFAPYLTNLEDADCLAYWLAGTMNIFLDQYYEFNVEQPILPQSYWCLELEPLMALGDAPLGMVSSGHANEWVTDLPLNAAFVEAMYARGYAPVHYAYSSNMVTLTFLEAVKATGGDTSPEKLMPAWRNVSINTPMGPISFDEEGCGIGNYYVYEWTKEGDEYYWKTLKAYEQMSMKCPAIDG
jgi:ABC-type branched-subunit amino acid transport system substrate-binding protein